MVVFPNCKINLGLNVVKKRSDGYHDLETIFYPVALRDGLEIVSATDFQLNYSGLPIAGEIRDNLVYKAWALLRNDYQQIPCVNTHLHKVIPMGAGLGGGSSNGAFMLRLLNEKFHLQLSQQKLIEYALQLGSDCPFFIVNQPCFATGRGENLEPVTLDLSAYKILLINPGIHISTKEAFSAITPAVPGKSLKQIVQQPLSSWREEMTNDFERSVFPHHPEIKNIKQQLYDNGALYASMTGTGSTVFGIFKKDAPEDVSVFKGYFFKWI